MSTAKLGDERYLNLETFRKDGTGVKTPVWAAELDGKLVVVTDGTSYKVKRLRNNPKIRVAPCDARGNVHGDWVEGEARIIEDAAHAARADRALSAKYGYQKWILDASSKLFGRYGRRAYLELTV